VTDELGRKVGTGAMWQAANVAVLRVANFAVGLVVARIVIPYDFGVFTVAMTVCNIIGSLASIGFISAIVREPDRTKKIAPTVLTMTIVTSILLTAAMYFSAPALASSLGSASATDAVRVLSLYIFLSGFGALPVALMTRDFMQRQRFIVDGSFSVSSTAVMFVLIEMGHPVIGLALSRVIGQLFTVVLANVLSPEKYLPGFAPREAKQLLVFGIPLTASRLVSLSIANIDFIVVGHVLGAQQLGYYNLAFNICSWPLTIFSAILDDITLPTLSRVRDSPRELARHLEAGLSGLAAASFLTCGLLAGLALPLIDAVYGPRWQPAWAPLVLLSVFGAIQTILGLFWDLNIALGMTRRLFIIQIVWLAALAPAMYYGVSRWHTPGAGLAHTVVVAGLVFPIYLITVKRTTSLGLGWVRRGLLVPLAGSTAAGLTAYEISRLVAGDWTKVLVGIVAGLLVYSLIAGRWFLRIATTLRAMYWKAPYVARHSAAPEEIAHISRHSAAMLAANARDQ
jgi:O-antigen/teichoic acid export membrane protein